MHQPPQICAGQHPTVSPADLGMNISFSSFHDISIDFFFPGFLNWGFSGPPLFQQMGSSGQAEEWFLLLDKTRGPKESQTQGLIHSFCFVFFQLHKTSGCDVQSVAWLEVQSCSPDQGHAAPHPNFPTALPGFSFSWRGGSYWCHS